jgi:hypothetical protein
MGKVQFYDLEIDFSMNSTMSENAVNPAFQPEE